MDGIAELTDSGTASQICDMSAWILLLATTVSSPALHDIEVTGRWDEGSELQITWQHTAKQIMFDRSNQRVDWNGHCHLIIQVHQSKRAVPINNHSWVNTRRQKFSQQLRVTNSQAASSRIHFFQHLLLNDHVLLFLIPYTMFHAHDNLKNNSLIVSSGECNLS